MGISTADGNYHEDPLDFYSAPITGAMQYPGDMDLTGNIKPSQPIGKVSDDITVNFPMSKNVEDRREKDNVPKLGNMHQRLEYLETTLGIKFNNLLTSGKLSEEIGINDVDKRAEEAQKRSDFRNDQVLKDFKSRRRSREYDIFQAHKAGNRY